MRELMNQILNKFDVDSSLISSLKIKLDDCRLDPSFFSSNQNFINSLKTQSLDTLCEHVFNPLVFKRDFIIDPSECRYLASAEIASLEPDITYITKDQSEKLNLRVKKGWILVTGFGTIGNIRIVDETINDFAVANNVTRIIPKEGLLGFLAAFLESSFGNKLLNDYSAGAVVKYIEAPQISKIPIPILSEALVVETNEHYLKAVYLREDASKCLLKAKQLVLQYNCLPQISQNDIETIDPKNETAIRLVSASEFTNEFRLDAHYYNPIAKKVIDNIQSNSKSNSILSELTSDIIIGKRFKRNYVESDFGTPFLSGKNIVQIRPHDLKYLSDTEISFIDELLIKQNWILITCSGTLGRTCFVYKNFENYAASQHILRVVPNEELIDPAYLYCFLSTDYGYHQIVRNKYGSVIDEIDDKNMEKILVPIPSVDQQEEIGNLVRKCYKLRAEALSLEDQAQILITKDLTGL